MLAQKKGIPISLAMLHAAVGRRAGLPIEFVGMPMHFMNKLRSHDSQEEHFIDVFAGGRILDRLVSCVSGGCSADWKHLPSVKLVWLICEQGALKAFACIGLAAEKAKTKP